jgi:hypothetical protein
MKNILRNRRALSTVVTTLIILVVSVLLAGVVTYFAINVTSTRVQEESLQITMLHVWFSQTSGNPAESAFLIINTGGRDVVINKITVRGQAADFSTSGSSPVYYVIPSAAVTEDLLYTPGATATLAAAKTYLTGTGPLIDGTATPLTGATGDITLKSGDSMVVYILQPDSITINDIGLTVGITVFTSQAMYYQEANVQAAA